MTYGDIRRGMRVC